MIRAACLLALLLTTEATAVGCGTDTGGERLQSGIVAPDAAISLDVGAEPAPSNCPADPPTEGVECPLAPSQPHLLCSYGEAPLAGCRSRWACVARRSTTLVDVPRWWAQQHGCDGETSDCPAARPSDGSAPCTPSARGCAYGDGALCWCIADGAETRWACTTPSAGCPAKLPNEGDACDDARSCLYGITHVVRPPGIPCTLGAHATCKEGRWEWTTGCSEK